MFSEMYNLHEIRTKLI